MSRRKKCEFCSQKPVISEGVYDYCESQIEISTGCWISMYIGANENGEVVMRACADDSTDDYHPKYCPECGRKLQ